MLSKYTEAANLDAAVQRGKKVVKEAFFSHIHICIYMHNILLHAATLTFTNVRSLNGYFNTLSSMDEIFKWDNIMFMCFDTTHYSRNKKKWKRTQQLENWETQQARRTKQKKLTSYLNKKIFACYFISLDELRWASNVKHDELKISFGINWTIHIEIFFTYVRIQEKRREEWIQVHHYVFFSLSLSHS